MLHFHKSEQTLLNGAHSLFIHYSQANNPNSLFYLHTMIDSVPSVHPTIPFSHNSPLSIFKNEKTFSTYSILHAGHILVDTTHATGTCYPWLLVQPSNLSKYQINTFYLRAFCRNRSVWKIFLMVSTHLHTKKNKIKADCTKKCI